MKDKKFKYIHEEWLPKTFFEVDLFQKEEKKVRGEKIEKFPKEYIFFWE